MFTKSEIKERFPVSFYQRGLTYYQNGRVSELTYDPEDQSYRAYVNGSSDYGVLIELLGDNWFGSCECQAFETYGTCKHLAAVLIAISEEGPPEEESEKSSQVTQSPRTYLETNQLIQVLSDYQPEPGRSNARVDELKVEFTLKASSYPTLRKSQGDSPWTLELKVGVNRLYVVKDIRSFLDAILEEQSYWFTKKFSYEPDEHRFHEADEPLMQILLAIRRNEKVYLDLPDNWGRFTENRELILPPLTANEFLTEFIKQERFLRFEYNRNLYEEIALVERGLPFSFEIDEMDNEYVIQLNGFQSAAYFPTYGWLFHEEKLYKLSKKQQSLLRDLSGFRNAARKSELSISSAQIEPFLSQVVPGLKKLGNVVISEQINDKIINPELQAKVYVNAEGDRLLVTVEYEYGEDVINPFKDSNRIVNEQGIVLRDSEKEQAIMSLIEQASLKFNGKELYVEDEALIFDFLYWTIPELNDLADVFLTESARAWLLDESSAPVTSVDMDNSGNWLDVSFDMKGLNEEEISNILKAVIEKDRYYRLSNGTFVSMENEDFQHVSQLFDDLNIKQNDIDRGELHLPLYRGLQLDERMSGGKHGSRYSKAFRDLVSRLKHPEDLQFDLPSSLEADLRSYQMTGFQWLKALAHYHLGGILADDMGLGKTLQSIAYLLSEKQDNPEATALVVAPASLIYNWKKEFEKFAPDLTIEVNTGTPTERKELLNQGLQPDVWITSYPTLRQDIDHYETIQFDSVILDEAQAIKNPVTKTSQAVRMLRAKKRFALSGTPIENSLDELWALFHSIMPGFFPDQATFRNLPHERISRMVKPFILRRVKKDVLKELPDKIETVQVSELTKQQKELYIGYLHRIQQETKESLAGDGFQKNRMKILAGLTRLRQLCCHPSLFVENYQGQSGKLEQLLDIVTTSIDNKKRLLIFSQFSSMLKIIHQKLVDLGYSAFYLDGQTPSKDRVEMTERFNGGENEIFLISLKAGGTGLNLTGADTVILYDLWWNPAVEEQAAGRAHRIGQKKVVQVMRLITQGTIEEKIYELQQKKKELIEKVIQPGETMISSLSEEEIKDILSI
ncbi:DEAD/DEAH box helicase [Bacillus sp. RAR_GA_16]|uniref:DEAD/DEAH box helicase n=1 Tax=Bacillus sp. RAR_GA_16 TaxID=2876774 RepID=UPI001CCCD054|nr:DEAD/DEAH box helicase [Bacillus sp. RAR_GA_16]MCA0172478.1 DEAD/DEAH box helicase [Bacillus sp. RAR_GA_16]